MQGCYSSSGSSGSGAIIGIPCLSVFASAFGEYRVDSSSLAIVSRILSDGRIFKISIPPIFPGNPYLRCKPAWRRSGGRGDAATGISGSKKYYIRGRASSGGVVSPTDVQLPVSCHPAPLSIPFTGTGFVHLAAHSPPLRLLCPPLGGLARGRLLSAPLRRSAGKGRRRRSQLLLRANPLPYARQISSPIARSLRTCPWHSCGAHQHPSALPCNSSNFAKREGLCGR